VRNLVKPTGCRIETKTPLKAMSAGTCGGVAVKSRDRGYIEILQMKAPTIILADNFPATNTGRICCTDNPLACSWQRHSCFTIERKSTV